MAVEKNQGGRLERNVVDRVTSRAIGGARGLINMRMRKVSEIAVWWVEACVCP